MTAILVDSNVLLDLMTQDAQWFAWSASALASAANRFRLVVNPIIYAEVSIRYSHIEDLDAALPKNMFDREAPATRAAPVTTHPRLWITADDLPKLRGWAVDSNPMFKNGLSVAASIAKADMG